MRTLIRHLKSAIVRSLGGAPSDWFARGYSDPAHSAPDLTRPYTQSAWVHACVSRIAGPISAMDLYFTARGEEVNDPELAAWWSAPAFAPGGARLPYSEFVEACAAWLLLEGEVFFLLDDSWALPFPALRGLRRSPLILARPDRLRHETREGQLTGWVFTDAAGRQVRFEPDRVIQVKLFNPYDEFRGLGKLESALIAAGGDYAAAIYAKNIAEANGDQGVYIIAKNGIPTDEQQAQIISQLREKREYQLRGVFKPIFLSGDVAIEDPKLRAVDTAFIAQRADARKEIAIAFGVPPSFFDPVASYSIGSASDRFILIEETCKPLGKKLCGGFERVTARLLGRELDAALDWDAHSTMQQVRRESLEAAVRLWSAGMPMATANQYLALDLPRFPGWETGYLPFGIAPVGETLAAPTATLGGELALQQRLFPSARAQSLERSRPARSLSMPEGTETLSRLRYGTAQPSAAPPRAHPPPNEKHSPHP
jgi:hypothetical protein